MKNSVFEEKPEVKRCSGIISCIASSFSDFLFPPICLICRSYISNYNNIDICESCYSSFKKIVPPQCSICGIPFLGGFENHICGECALHPPAFDSALSLFEYCGDLKDLIHDFKYRPKPIIRKSFANLILQNCAEDIIKINPDAIAAVPLHPKRLRQRGFNQAILIAEVVAKNLNIPLLRDILIRTRMTKPQVNLSAKERRENVKGAFEANRKAQSLPQKIILIDDVFTTGSTVSECAKALKKEGVSQVSVLTVARAA